MLAVSAVAGLLFALLLSASLAISSVLAPRGLTLPNSAASPFDLLISATAFLGMAAVAIPAAYYSVGYLAGLAPRPLSPKPLRAFPAIALILLWIGSVVLAGLAVNSGPWKWLTPLPYLMAIGIPVYWLMRLVAGGQQVGSTRRFWGLLYSGMTVGPIVAMSVELALVILLGLFAVLYLAMHPGQLSELQTLTAGLTAAPSSEQTLSLLAPILTSPLTFFLGLAFFSGFAPVIEETAKSIAIWTVFDRLDSAAQGLVAGALSGSGFGLLESLLASAAPDPNWAPILFIRGGSSIMHIAAASLTGLGIASFRRSRHIWPLLGGYGAAMLLHGLWNASVVSITYGALRLTTNATGPTVVDTFLAGAGGLLLALLFLGIPIGLGVLSAAFRRRSLTIQGAGDGPANPNSPSTS